MASSYVQICLLSVYTIIRSKSSASCWSSSSLSLADNRRNEENVQEDEKLLLTRRAEEMKEMLAMLAMLMHAQTPEVQTAPQKAVSSRSSSISPYDRAIADHNEVLVEIDSVSIR